MRRKHKTISVTVDVPISESLYDMCDIEELEGVMWKAAYDAGLDHIMSFLNLQGELIWPPDKTTEELFGPPARRRAGKPVRRRAGKQRKGR